jgi:hypothetical protein
MSMLITPIISCAMQDFCMLQKLSLVNVLLYRVSCDFMSRGDP